MSPSQIVSPSMYGSGNGLTRNSTVSLHIQPSDVVTSTEIVAVAFLVIVGLVSPSGPHS